MTLTPGTFVRFNDNTSRPLGNGELELGGMVGRVVEVTAHAVSIELLSERYDRELDEWDNQIVYTPDDPEFSNPPVQPVVTFKAFPGIEFPEFLRDLGFVDVSWSNDACARASRDVGEGMTLSVWVEFAHSSDRESGGSQFAVVFHDTAHPDEYPFDAFECEAVGALEKYVREFLAERS